MEPENKKVWSRLETHEEWKSRIEKELLLRKEQEKAKIEIENELRKRTERKTAKLKKKKELQEAKKKLEEIENHENDMDYRFTKKKKELPHEAKVKLEKIEISENDVDYRFPLENKNSKPNENLQLKEIKIHENDVDYRYKLDNVNSKDSGNNNDYKLIPIKKEPLDSNEELELIMSPIDIDNEIEHLLSQEVRNLYSGLQIKTFQVLDYFDPTYSTTQCFNHFKCMICQVEIHSRQATIFHAKTKIHKKNRKLYSVVEKSTILEKLLEATQKDKEERLEKQSNLILRSLQENQRLRKKMSMLEAQLEDLRK